MGNLYFDCSAFVFSPKENKNKKLIFKEDLKTIFSMLISQKGYFVSIMHFRYSKTQR